MSPLRGIKETQCLLDRATCSAVTISPSRGRPGPLFDTVLLGDTRMHSAADDGLGYGNNCRNSRQLRHLTIKMQLHDTRYTDSVNLMQKKLRAAQPKCFYVSCVYYSRLLTYQ